MATKVLMPQLGEGVFEGTIARWLKAEGDRVELYEPILEIETDKVTTEATAEEAGTLLKIIVPEGETVEVGQVLAYLGEPGEEISETAETPSKTTQEKEPAATKPQSARQPASNGAPREQSEPEPTPTRTAPGGAREHEPGEPYTGRISPVVGRIAEEHDVNLDMVRGTGRDGRITKKDILAYVEQREEEAPGAPERAAPKPVPQPTPTDLQAGELLPLTSMRRAIAEHMVMSKRTSPHVTTVFEIDFSAVAAHRRANKEAFARDGTKLTFTAYIVAAIVRALKAHPLVNSTWTEEGILLKRAINVGMATAIQEGLIVPIIKGADSYNLLGLARVINDLAERARAGQLKPDEVQDGTFTLTNHGVSGSLFATPIINQPQCAILGTGKIEKRVKVIDDAIAIRPMAFASLTFDHRILDGASADHFMSTFKQTLENW